MPKPAIRLMTLHELHLAAQANFDDSVDSGERSDISSAIVALATVHQARQMQVLAEATEGA